jgi:hypothetical protein
MTNQSQASSMIKSTVTGKTPIAPNISHQSMLSNNKQFEMNEFNLHEQQSKLTHVK